jgi:hypothetical protein
VSLTPWIFSAYVALAALSGCRTIQTESAVTPAAGVTDVSVAEAQTSASTTLPSRDSLSKEWGIEIIGLRRSAGGYMLDFRYKVLDPEKAAGLFKREDKPYLIDQASGRKFLVPNPPKVGPMRTSNKPQANRNYFVMFGNPGTFIQSGNKVTIVIGDFRVEDLVVE